MVQKELEIELEIKEQARFPARVVTEIVGEASQVEAELKLIQGGQEANLKSVISLMALELIPEEKAVIKGRGEGAKEAVEEISKIIKEKLARGGDESE